MRADRGGEFSYLFFMRSVLWIFLLLSFFPRHEVLANIQGMNLVDGRLQTYEFTESQPYQVLVFLSSVCPCSRSHEVALGKAVNKFSKQGFRFIGVLSNSEESKESLVSYFSESSLKMPFIFDHDQVLANRFKAFKTPHVFILNSQEDILYQGAVSNSRNFNHSSENYLERALLQIVKNQKPEPSLTKAMGCQIFRK